MGLHYICRGECQVPLVAPGECTDSECTRYGRPFDPCTCQDGNHSGILEDEPDESE